MRDIPIFTTELGVASLTLNQIPYTKKAYIRIQDSRDGERFLQECTSFCKAAGADYVYATGQTCCEHYPEYTKIIKMQNDLQNIGDTDAALFPVTERTIEKWREIYNDKVIRVPNGAYMNIEKAKDLMREGDGYFIHRNGELLGIGKASGDTLHWIASVKPGEGKACVRALCRGISADTVYLEVAAENRKAYTLYESLGFIPVSVVSTWYQII